MAAQIQNQGKLPPEIGQSINQSVRCLSEEEIMASRPQCRAITPLAQELAIKHLCGARNRPNMAARYQPASEGVCPRPFSHLFGTA